MKAKKGQGTSAAILVAIIAGLFILYIMFLPSPEREKLLDPNEEYRGDSDDIDILLEEFVGRLDVGEDLEDQKDIPNVFLFQTTNSRVLENINPFVVRNGWFDDQPQSYSFRIDDLDNTENIFVTFTAPIRKGSLRIDLNGQGIFEAPLTTTNVEPIELEKALLQEANTITFSVSGVGAKFWSTNEFSVQNVKIIGDITDRTRQESKNIFVISGSEFDNLEKAEIRFIPYCRSTADVGRLDLEINNREVFSAVPVCEDPYKQIIPSHVLTEGQNKVVFKTTKGSYSVEQIFVELEFKETRSKTFFFEINESRFEEIFDDREEVRLIIEFVDTDEDQEGTLDINGKLRSFDQDDFDRKDNELRLDINNFIEEGNNFVRIEPEKELNIVELRVEIEDE